MWRLRRAPIPAACARLSTGRGNGAGGEAGGSTGSVAQPSRREAWMASDTATVFGRARSPAVDAGSEDDDYTSLDLEVISRALEAVKCRSAALGIADGTNNAEADADALAAAASALQSARKGAEAEMAFLCALAARRSCGAAWYGLASLLHEYQHGGLPLDGTGDGSAGQRQRDLRLREAADAALIAARYEPRAPRSLALLGDILNDLGSDREACRAWAAAEVRGTAHWRRLAQPWLERVRTAPSQASVFGPREPLRSLRVGAPAVPLVRRSNGGQFTALRLATRPAAFLLRNFSTGAERDAIVAAAVDAPMRAVPRAEDGDEADERRGCEVAWLSSPLTVPDSAWAALMTDAVDVVLPSAQADSGLPGPGPLEDLHVVK
jgi:hypothetical protein